MAGEHLINVQSESVESATNIDQLRPDLKVIKASIGTMSPGERLFILSLYQFFNDSTVQELCKEFDCSYPSLPDIANLDTDHRVLILRLVDSYRGW